MLKEKPKSRLLGILWDVISFQEFPSENFLSKKLRKKNFDFYLIGSQVDK